jgi:hypothetical protein
VEVGLEGRVELGRHRAGGKCRPNLGRGGNEATSRVPNARIGPLFANKGFQAIRLLARHIMGIRLEAIKFNHDATSASADALNIRRNAAQDVPVPEWVRGTSVNPEDSLAAYSIADTQGHTLTIQAKFSQTGPPASSVEIRAIDPTLLPPNPPYAWYWFFWWIYWLLFWVLRALLRALYGNVLGEVVARPVQFQANGQSAFESFQLQGVNLWTAGVGARTTTWRWQSRTGSGAWTDFDTSTHRIYSLLETPKAPWQQQPYASSNKQLPWTEVLDYACRWALLSTTRDGAAGGVTKGVNDLGPGTVTYDCPGGGAAHYVDYGTSSFECTAFLDRLRGGLGNGVYVNCTDCATIVSSFANALGCDLWQSRMGYGFGLNPMLGIGSATWQPACGWSSFSYHEVAWKGACASGDEVFDACLQVDGDGDPTAAPHTALLPVNMAFGATGAGQYRDRLATPAGRPNCNPQPATRVRRAIA